MAKINFLLLLLKLSFFSGMQAQSITLEHLWTRVGDSYGAVDVENATESIECAVFSPDEKQIVSGAKKGWEISLWETKSGKQVWQNRADEEIEVVGFTRNGKFVISGGEDKKIRIWKAKTGKLVRSVDNLAGFDAMDVANNRPLVAMGDEAGQILLINTLNWKQTDLVMQGEDELTGAAQGVHADVNQLHFSADDQQLLSAGRNGEVKLWKVTEKDKLELVRTFRGHTSTVKSVRMSPDGHLVAAGAGGGEGVRIWNLQSGELIHHIPGTAMIMETVAFTPDGKFLFTGGNEGEGKIGAPVENQGFENNNGMGHLRAYRVPQTDQESFEMVLEMPLFRQEFLDFSKNGKLMVTSHEDGTLRLWKVNYQQ
jgi:WD40 repeat protein